MTEATNPASVPAAPTNVVMHGGAQMRIVAVPVGRNPIAEMLQSKKFLALLAGMFFTLLAKVGVNVSDATQEQVLNLVMVYIGAQGVADAGQGFARARNTAPALASPPTTS